MRRGDCVNDNFVNKAIRGAAIMNLGHIVAGECHYKLNIQNELLVEQIRKILGKYKTMGGE